ncbi:radical SAM protein [Dethiothermospora halolimnae]|uniref:radical SAM protein n=1 Tax=Dethiothermospora halolimnae TaxID=3114390 RepID=UPI003CCBF032
MKSAKQLIGSVMLKEGLKYLEKDPIKNIPKLMNWADRLITEENHRETLESFKEIWDNPDNNWHKFIERLFTEIHPNVRNKFIMNFFINSSVLGLPLAKKLKKKHDCNIPWAILMDPTAACNLKCKGCWAAEYNKTDSMDYELLDRIITEGKELGTYMYIYSGGEPLVRKDDLIKLAKEHDDCMFLAFTNATLVDEDFAKKLQDVGNFALAISVEGFEKSTDMRRGEGTYNKVMDAMKILREYGIGFGFSTCYHRENTEDIGSEEYIDFMVEKGCMFGWYFTYMPLGKDAILELLAKPEQREFMYHRVREMREEKPIFVMDFWNDGEYVEGCIAGGRNYLHINASGDVEPCAFIHYSNVNIKDVSLLEALKSPIFKEYKKGQPFNDNHLRPCPLLDNPDRLKKMVNKSGAKSTQPIDKESVEELTDKCQMVSKNWAKKAEVLWKERAEKKKKMRL